MRSTRRSHGHTTEHLGLTLAAAIALAAGAVGAGSVQAASPSFGVLAGVNLSDLAFDPDQDLDTKSRVGFHGGAIVDLPISPMFGVRTGAIYSMKGQKQEGEMLIENVLVDFEGTTKLTYLAIPALVQLRIGESEAAPYLLAGPQGNIKLSAEESIDVSAGGFSESEDFDLDDETKSFALDAVFGAGIEIPVGESAIGLIQISYELGLTDLNDTENADEEEGEAVDIKNQTFAFSAGLRF